ncbi:MAG TPA: GNAT family protein [Ignavibacteria bacterium]|nr:GNAT family protein [Ignavibacteria bacterium]HMQ98647.1 GNAT family protein [Ignavibacteria bacterium]
MKKEFKKKIVIQFKIIATQEYLVKHKVSLFSFLSSGYWPFHSVPKIPIEKLEKQYAEGYFNSESNKTFLILNEVGSIIGVIRLFDLGSGKDDDETPLFDIKIKEEYRGKGIGKQALSWLTDLVFTNYPNKLRFEATTRVDNIAMRKVFEYCGFVKEAHYRQAWPDAEGNRYDCTGYAILRSDWLNKTKTPVKFEL